METATLARMMSQFIHGRERRGMSVRRGRSICQCQLPVVDCSRWIAISRALGAWGGGVFADQVDSPAPFAVFDPGHIGFDQQNSPTGELLQVGFLGGVRDSGSVKTGAF